MPKFISNLQVIEIGNEIALLNPETGKYHMINPIGNIIWKMIDNSISIDEIIQKLLLQYEVDEDVCRNDVIEFISNVHNEKLIKLE